MEDLITTNKNLNDVFQRLRNLFTIKGILKDYWLKLEYRAGKLDEVEVDVWGFSTTNMDDNERYKLANAIAKKLELAINPSDNYKILEAEYKSGGCKIHFLIHL